MSWKKTMITYTSSNERHARMLKEDLLSRSLMKNPLRQFA